MRIALTNENGEKSYVETQHIVELDKKEGNKFTTVTILGLGEEGYCKETPEEIEQLERQAIIDRDEEIQAKKAKNFGDQVFEGVEKRNNDTLEQVRSIVKVLSDENAELKKRLDALENPKQ